jgi:NADPH-dependent 2,4-dienoyl-CoA reductase/sulfur reductase-like enzyme
MTGARVAIVGGVAGGMSAAARLRRLDEHAHITFANCGLASFVSGAQERRRRTGDADRRLERCARTHAHRPLVRVHKAGAAIIGAA